MGEKKDASQEQVDLQELRTKTLGEKSILEFKRSVVGGLNPKDVEEYINSLTEQFKMEEEQYQNRFEEFTTFNEMLKKERDKAVKQLQDVQDEIDKYKKEITALKNENIDLKQQMEHNRVLMEELSSKNAKKDENNNVINESEQVKSELKDIYAARDKLAGEKSVLLKQLEDSKNHLSLVKKENESLTENLIEVNGVLRRMEMNKKLKLSEFSEKHAYAINKTTQGLDEIASALEDMKKEMQDLLEKINEEKVTVSDKE